MKNDRMLVFFTIRNALRKLHINLLSNVFEDSFSKPYISLFNIGLVLDDYFKD